MSDIVERLRRVAKELPQTSGNQAWLKPEDTTVWEAADEIEKLRAAVQDLAKHVWRGDWDKLKPETRELLGEKQ